MSEGRRTRAQTMGSGKKSSGGGSRIPGAAAALAAADDASSSAAAIAFPAAPCDEEADQAPKRRRVAPAAAWRRVMIRGKGSSSNNGAESSPVATAADCSPPPAATDEHSAPIAAAPSVFQYSRSKPPPLMLEASAREIARQLGLSQAAVPALNEDYCNAFISSYVKETQTGIVKNQPVQLIGEAVASILEVPIGGSFAWEAGDIHDNTDSLAAAFRALFERMGCTIAGNEVAAALGSCQTYMQWSSHLADRMHRAILLTREENVIYGCGRWLSGLIQKALGEPVTWEALDALEQQQQVVDHPSGAASMKQQVMETSTASAATEDDSDDDAVIRHGRKCLAAFAAQAQKNAEGHLTQQSQEQTAEDEAHGERDPTCEEKCMITAGAAQATPKNDLSLKLSEFTSKTSLVHRAVMEFEKGFANIRDEILALNSELLNAKARENSREARIKALRLEAEKQQEELQKEKAEHDEIAGKLRQEAEESRQKLHAMNEGMEKLRASKKIWTEEKVSKDLKLERLENELASTKAMEKARDEDLLQAKTQLIEVSERLCLAQNVEMVCRNQLERIKAEHKDELIKVKQELEKQTSLRELWEKSVDHDHDTFRETYEAYVELKQRHKELRSQHKALLRRKYEYAPST